MNRRRAILLLVLAGLLATAALWSYGTMAEQRAAMAAAANDLVACREIANRIEKLRRRPELAAQNQRDSSETIGLIETSARAAGITTAKLLRISPEPPRRLGDTVYMETPTRVELKNVTLEQLVKLVHGIAGDENPLHPRSIQVRAPSPRDTGRLWSAELVLTYLIYEPPRTQR